MNDKQPPDGPLTHSGASCAAQGSLTEARGSLTEAQAAEQTRERLRHLPPEVGVVLLSAGVAGLILPGPIGTPLVLAGGLVLAPRAFDRLERWVQRRFPLIHQHGRRHLDRFIDDFQRRYPARRG
ncbi:MAG TPA: hypothetical protein VGX78_16090 [Pirellulales bacterium]|jgi:hypothetical protein|nr:hypothetical protein [Pirellulales bacterium]